MSSARGRSKVGLALTEPELNILLSLSEGERHGYRMMQEARERSGGRVAMGAGTLYGAIKRLRIGGLIEETAEQPEAAANARRRCYRITEAGAKTLVDDIAYMQTLVRAYHAIVGPRA